MHEDGNRAFTVLAGMPSIRSWIRFSSSRYVRDQHQDRVIPHKGNRLPPSRERDASQVEVDKIRERVSHPSRCVWSFKERSCTSDIQWTTHSSRPAGINYVLIRCPLEGVLFENLLQFFLLPSVKINTESSRKKQFLEEPDLWMGKWQRILHSNSMAFLNCLCRVWLCCAKEYPSSQ